MSGQGLSNTYGMGETPEETTRLLGQAVLYERSTSRLLEDAGIQEGMRILDVGCGAGDVALLAAARVGPHGSVIGVDRNPELIAQARDRAQRLGLAQLSFVNADLHELPFQRDFDAVVGRLILCHMADPVETLRVLARHVRVGGLAVFQELQLEMQADVKGISPRIRKDYETLLEGYASAKIRTTMGMDLFRAYRDAGLEPPYLSGFTALGCRPDWAGFDVAANSWRTLLPIFERSGTATADQLDLDGMAARFSTEVDRLGLPFIYATFIGAWGRVLS